MVEGCIGMAGEPYGADHERKLMLQWWADFLDAHRDKGITPFDYAKINRGNGE